jgi:COMPASS component SWD3
VTELAAGMWQYPGHSNRIFSIKFHPEDQNIMLSCGWDNTIYFWDLRDSKSFASCYGPAVTGDSLDIKGNYILTGSWRNKEQLELWDYGQRKKVSNILWDGDINLENAYIYGCQFSKRDNESILAGCSNLNEVRIFDRMNNNKPVVKIHDMKRAVYSVDWANTSDMFAFCGGDGRAHVIGINKN